MNRKYLLFPLVLMLTACGSFGEPQYKLKGYNGPEAMDNNEVVMLSKQCILNKMKPDVNYLMVKTDHGKTMVPVSVNCIPY
jgi:hypothetical protein